MLAELSPVDRIVALAQHAGVLRPRDLQQHGIARQYLRLAEQQGRLTRIGRGLYTTADHAPSEWQSFQEVAKRMPRAVISLLSALRFHDLTTQSPFEVWIAIGLKDRQPTIEYPPVRVVRLSASILQYGAEQHTLGGVPVQVFSAAKTVADCFKYRNKIGLDVALEALRDCLRRRKATPAELAEAARICRVQNVMRPYLEALA